LVVLLRQFLRVAETFQQNKVLVSLLGGNSFLEELHDALKIIMDSGVLSLLEIILDIQ